LLLLSLIFTSSRAAWLALAAGFGVWALWALRGRIRGRIPPAGWLATAVFGGLVLLAMAGGLLLVWMAGGQAVAARLSGSVTSASRLGLAADALRLIGDVPFTGSGLRSFGGWYSQYILVIPNFMFSYAHNFYLDVALEQGLSGLLALLAVLGGAGWRLLTTPLSADADSGWWRGALLASLVVVLGHGLMDDALYGNVGTPFLWLLPGLVLVWQGERAWGRWRWGWGVAVGVTAVLLLAVLFWRPVRAQWLANRAAVGMARVELAGWPRDEWDDGRSLSQLEPVQTQLAAALALDPENGTALYRAGLLAMLARDYETAVSYLERAAVRLPGHRGVQKNLGYSYLWLGDVENATPLLAQFPEVGRELAAYVDWWGRNGRPDLAQQARGMIDG
jgi:O-antigen ligase